MSKIAALMNEDGTYTHVNACDCGHEDKGKDYRCLGKWRGKECLAPLELRIGSSIENYFAVVSGAEHIHGCPNDESGRKLYAKVLDREGKECTPQSLYSMLLAKGFGKQPGGGDKGGEGPEEGPEEKYPKDDETLPGEDLVLIKRAPHNLKEIVNSLRYLKADDSYAGTVVEELICDRNNVAKFKKSEFGNNGVMIVAAWRTKPPKGYRVARDEFVLLIDGAFDSKLYLSFKATDDALEFLKKAENKRFFLINCWKRERKFKNVFRGADQVTKHMICVL